MEEEKKRKKNGDFTWIRISFSRVLEKFWERFGRMSPRERTQNTCEKFAGIPNVIL